MAQAVYDAIVVGSGATGGWAAKELTEKGLRVIMLEAGRKLDPAKDYKMLGLAVRLEASQSGSAHRTAEKTPANSVEMLRLRRIRQSFLR